MRSGDEKIMGVGTLLTSLWDILPKGGPDLRLRLPNMGQFFPYSSQLHGMPIIGHC
jgi:hypothetical protein